MTDSTTSAPELSAARSGRLACADRMHHSISIGMAGTEFLRIAPIFIEGDGSISKIENFVASKAADR